MKPATPTSHPSKVHVHQQSVYEALILMNNFFKN